MKTIENKIKNLEKEFISKMKRKGIQLSNNAVCRITERSIVIGIKETDLKRSGFKIMFASDIKIWTKTSNSFSDSENRISIGSSGSFNPSNIASYWRIIHGANILKNWEVSCQLVNDFCNRYENLFDKIKSEDMTKQHLEQSIKKINARR